MLGPNIIGVAFEGSRVELVGLRSIGNVDVVDWAIAEKLTSALPRLGNDGIFVERLAEDALCVGQKLRAFAVSAQRGRGAHSAEEALWRAEPRLEPPDEAGQVGALSTVEGVQLVDDEKTQRLGAVVLPQLEVPLPHEQVVEHLVVGEQNARRREPHGRSVGDDALPRHDLHARR